MKIQDSFPMHGIRPSAAAGIAAVDMAAVGIAAAGPALVASYAPP